MSDDRRLAFSRFFHYTLDTSDGESIRFIRPEFIRHVRIQLAYHSEIP